MVNLQEFIRENTAQIRPPHVPEIILHLADDAHELWQKTEDDLNAIGLAPPFWAFAWAGGQGLARFILDHDEAIRGKNVLDLATGSGLVAIAAKLGGAKTVIANDIEPMAEYAVRMNATANGVAVVFDASDLLGDGERAQWLDETEIILAGDVFYDAQFASSVSRFFKREAARGTRILVGDPGRSYLPKNGLVELAEYQVPVSRALEDMEVKRSRVFEYRGE